MTDDAWQESSMGFFQPHDAITVTQAFTQKVMESKRWYSGSGYLLCMQLTQIPSLVSHMSPTHYQECFLSCRVWSNL